MSYANDKITAPVSIYDVQQALGNASTDLGTLCKASNINMWAKFKPIYCGTISPLKNSQRANSGHVVSGYAISFGIMKPSAWQWSDYINPSTGEVSSGLWEYDKPVGGSVSPFRLSDFAEINDSGDETGYGYDHRAVCPIAFGFSSSSELPVPYQSTYEGTVLSFVFTFQNGVYMFNPHYCMGLADIFSQELNFYPTVIMTCYQNGRVWEYSKSADNTLSYYIGNDVNPYVQVLVDTKDLCDAIANDGASYHSGPLADGQVWTCCMVLTSLKVAGGVTTHSVSSGSIRRIEYAAGVDRRDLTVVNTTPLNGVSEMSFTITVRKSSNGTDYYLDSVSVRTKTQGVSDLHFTVDATMVCLKGYMSGTGWNNVQQQTWNGWSSLDVHQTGSVHTDTQNLSASMPNFNFTGDVGPNTRVISGTLTFRIGSARFAGSFGWNVYDGAASYSSTITLK